MRTRLFLYIGFIFFLSNLLNGDNFRVDFEDEYRSDYDILIYDFKLQLEKDDKNFEKFIKKVDVIGRKWKSKNNETYIKIMLTASNIVSCWDYDAEKLVIRNEYTNKASEVYNNLEDKAVDLKLLIDLEYLSILYTSLKWGKVISTDYETMRYQKIKNCFDAYKNLDEMIDRDYRNSVLMPFNKIYAKMDDGSIKANVSPELIGNISNRQEYEEKLRINKERVLYRKKHSEFEDAEKQFKGSMLTFFPFMYSIEPYNQLEVQTFIDQITSDESYKEMLLDWTNQKVNFQINVKKYQQDKARREAQEK